MMAWAFFGPIPGNPRLLLGRRVEVDLARGRRGPGSLLRLGGAFLRGLGGGLFPGHSTIYMNIVEHIQAGNRIQIPVPGRVPWEFSTT